MTAVFIAPTEIIVSAMAPSKYDRHIQDFRWHARMTAWCAPDYLADIAARQAAKRAAGIGPEGRCHA